MYNEYIVVADFTIAGRFYDKKIAIQFANDLVEYKQVSVMELPSHKIIYPNNK